MKFLDPDARILNRLIAEAVVSEDAPLNRVFFISPRPVEMTEEEWLLRCCVLTLTSGDA